MIGTELPGISFDERCRDEEGVAVGQTVSVAVPLSDVDVVERTLDEAVRHDQLVAGGSRQARRSRPLSQQRHTQRLAFT